MNTPTSSADAFRRMSGMVQALENHDDVIRYVWNRFRVGSLTAVVHVGMLKKDPCLVLADQDVLADGLKLACIIGMAIGRAYPIPDELVQAIATQPAPARRMPPSFSLN